MYIIYMTSQTAEKGKKRFSHTPCRDTAISPGVGYLYPSPPIAISPMLFYPTELSFYDNNNKKMFNKLPQTTIIFRIIDGTIRFNNAKKHTRTLFKMCPS